MAHSHSHPFPHETTAPGLAGKTMPDETAVFYAAATPRPGAEGAFGRAVDRLSGHDHIDGVHFKVLETVGMSVALRGQIRQNDFPEAPEALATYLEDRLAAQAGILLNLDITIA